MVFIYRIFKLLFYSLSYLISKQNGFFFIPQKQILLMIDQNVRLWMKWHF